MTTQSQAGKVQTVVGPLDPEQLGVTITHEHLLADHSYLISPPAEASAKGFYYKPMSMETLGLMKHYSDSLFNPDDLMMRDVDTAIEETMHFKQYGGDSIVDVTPRGSGRDPVGLARISRATGVNIIMGGTYYVDGAHPPEVANMSEDDILEQTIHDITEGVDGTGIKSGVIGEVGCTWPLTENERKVLRAAGRAQRMTGAPISIHPGRNPKSPFEILKVLSDAGADLGQTVMGHIERTILIMSDLKPLAETGCYIEWDLIGEERSFYGGQATNPDVGVKIDMPNDATRIDYMAWLASQGYGDRILAGHDIGFTHRLAKYGGHSFAYIPAHIAPRMRARGLDEEAVRKILVENPKRAFTFSEPKGP